MSFYLRSIPLLVNELCRKPVQVRIIRRPEFSPRQLNHDALIFLSEVEV